MVSCVGMIGALYLCPRILKTVCLLKQLSSSLATSTFRAGVMGGYVLGPVLDVLDKTSVGACCQVSNEDVLISYPEFPLHFACLGNNAEMPWVCYSEGLLLVNRYSALMSLVDTMLAMLPGLSSGECRAVIARTAPTAFNSSTIR